ncbi:MAG TPA: 3'-5' exonuclease [Desulfosporosinus sp.]|nr:3'-5' exonuclease [Desulfosporosinus sp.]
MVNCMVAISSDFLTAFAAIPRQKQGKVIDFMTKFRQNPSSASINYEKIHNAFDSNMHSVRIDDSYRGIVLKPEIGNVYLLLWVDNHDEAYAWAKKKRCIVNPTTGSLQVFDVMDAPEEPTKFLVEADDEVPTRQFLFAHIEAGDLMRIGVPFEIINSVKSIRSVSELNDKVNLLPLEAYEALLFIADGFEVEEIIRELFGTEITREETIDVNNFAVALNKPVSKQKFQVIEGEKELSEMLAAPLEKWRVFLHPSQRRIVEKNYNGAARVLGGAGTGKTIVAMHRAKWLAKNVYHNSKHKILFTTFTSNLASDIRENLKKICDIEVLRQIEVTNLDAWVSNFLRSQGYEYRIIYGAELDNLWDQAFTIAPGELGLGKEFYKDEWNKVIKPQEIDSLEAYVKASRLGRGVRMDRKARIAVWDIFKEMKQLMNEKHLRDTETAMSEARYLFIQLKSKLPYDAVIVDEAQDFSVQALKLIRAISGEAHNNDLFITGDAHQRIYRNKVTLKQCGINVRGRSSILKINYRTTEETRLWATRLLNGILIDDLDDGIEEGKGYKSLMHGPKPEVCHFESFIEETNYIIDCVHELETNGVDVKDICIAARTNKQLELYTAQLSQAGIRVYEVKRSKAEDRNMVGVRVATMHRVKGLEFNYVFIVGVNDGQVPLAAAIQSAGDKVGQTEMLTSERSLMYVAVTRAKKAAVVTCHGKRSVFVS